VRFRKPKWAAGPACNYWFGRVSGHDLFDLLDPEGLHFFERDDLFPMDLVSFPFDALQQVLELIGHTHLSWPNEQTSSPARRRRLTLLSGKETRVATGKKDHG
jgi:hypothetical protein